MSDEEDDKKMDVDAAEGEESDAKKSKTENDAGEAAEDEEKAGDEEEEEKEEGDKKKAAAKPAKKGQKKADSKPARKADEAKPAKKSEEKAEKAEKPDKKRKAEKEAKEEKDDEDEDDEDEDDEKAGGSYWNVESGAKRQRKSLEHFHPESGKEKEDHVEKILTQGKGEALKDIRGVADSIKDHTISKSDKNDHLKLLSRQVFNKIFQPRELKENLLNFSGMVFEDKKQEDNWDNRINKRTVAELKGMMACLHLERAGTQKELAARLIEFLKKPSAALAKGKAAPSKKKKSTGTKKPAKASKPKAKAGGKKGKKDDDTDDDEDEEEDEEEEEKEEEEEEDKKKKEKKAKSEKKEEKKDEKKQKPKPAEKKGKKAKAAADSGDEEDDKEGDDDKGEVHAKIKGHVEEICSKEDLSTLTLRMVREKLEKDFEVDIAEHKDMIKDIVNKYVAKHQKPL